MGCSRSDRLGRVAAAAGCAIGLVAGAAIAAPERARPAAQCFDITRVRTKLALDDRTLLARVDGGAVMQIDLSGSCPGLARRDPRIVFQSRGGSYVCDRLDLNLTVGRAGEPIPGTPCTVDAIRRLTPAEVAALPKDRRP